MAVETQQTDPAIRALLPGYLANRRKDISNLSELIASNQVEEIRRIGHNIKGSGGSYGLSEFSAVGEKIEQAAQANDIQALTHLLEALEKCTNHLAAQLET